MLNKASGFGQSDSKGAEAWQHPNWQRRPRGPALRSTRQRLYAAPL